MPPLVTLTALFVLGQFGNVLRRMAFAIRNPNNPIQSRRQYLAKNWDVMLFRMFVAQILFWAWVTYPDGLSKLCSMFHFNVDLAIPVKPVVALGAGLVSDVVLDYIASKIPFLKQELPTLNGNGKKPVDQKADAAGAGK